MRPPPELLGRRDYLVAVTRQGDTACACLWGGVPTIAKPNQLEVSGLPAGIIDLSADGGVDQDVLVGSDGDDVLLGGTGDDVLLGGPKIPSRDFTSRRRPLNRPP